MTARLEHANLCVRDIDATIRFLRIAFPNYRIRADQRDSDGTRWVHVGDDDTYIALTQATLQSAMQREPYSPSPGVNHLGYEIDDAEALRARMLTAGFRESTVPNNHPHRRRVYFLDPDGNDWEFVQYLSSIPDERNDYET